jgi:predicted transposase YbfD/YdcC
MGRTVGGGDGEERAPRGRDFVERESLLHLQPDDVRKSFAAAVRGHWGIENSLHWVLDVTFREDDCRVRKDHVPENLSLVRRAALNLLREEKAICKLGLKGKRHR